MAAEREDEAGLLCEPDELAGEHEAAVGMLPAHERLDPDDAARLERDDRLVVDVELVFDDSALEVGLERETFEDVLVHRGLVERVAALPLALRAVHREIGAAHDLVRRLAAGVERDPDAALHGDDVGAGDDERLGHRTEDPLRHGHGAVGSGDALDHHGELVAPETGARVLGPDRRADPLGDRDEELVTGGVTEAVVHGLEVVEIDEENGEEVPSARAALDCVRDALREERAVREPRERVVERLMRELVLERSALGDVTRGQYDTADVRLVEQVVEDALQLHDRAVLATERQVARHRRARQRAHLREEADEPLAVVAARAAR